ncbi:hypothetical protein [Caudoviricetes sp.]|nr:hypothetical protein [Caudoviricetes sp.]
MQSRRLKSDGLARPAKSAPLPKPCHPTTTSKTGISRQGRN